jgi:hypothetical protein
VTIHPFQNTRSSSKTQEAAQLCEKHGIMIFPMHAIIFDPRRPRLQLHVLSFLSYRFKGNTKQPAIASKGQLPVQTLEMTTTL